MRRLLEHPVAKLAKIVGKTQAAFAQLVGVPRPTLQAVEIGKRKLSPAVAEQIANTVGVRVEWLQTGRGKPRDWRGRLYGPNTLAEYRAHVDSLAREHAAPELLMPQALEDLAGLVSLLATVLDEADRRKKAPVFSWKLREAILKVGSELGIRGHRIATKFRPRAGADKVKRVYFEADRTLQATQEALWQREIERRVLSAAVAERRELSAAVAEFSRPSEPKQTEERSRRRSA